MVPLSLVDLDDLGQAQRSELFEDRLDVGSHPLARRAVAIGQ